MNRNRERPVFVVFEGLDGTGKSTCAKRTAELLGAQYMTTPSGVVRTYRDEIIASFGSSQDAAHYLYLSTVAKASSDVRACLEAGVSVVLDRYFLSTQVYAAFRGSPLNIEGAAEALLVPASLTVLLDTPLDVRRERLKERGCSADDNQTLCADADQELRQGYERRARMAIVGKLMRIDSSISSAEEIARRIVNFICGGEQVLV